MDKLKITQISIVAVIVIWLLTSFFIKNSLQENYQELNAKVQTQQKLDTLQKQWSMAQHFEQLKNFEKFLTVSVGSFIKKEQDVSIFYSMMLQSENANLVVNYLLSKNIILKSLKLRKIDEYTLEMDLEVEK